ncbi:MAG: hypothetical protein KBD31_02170 [Proteobacteria bacterium]|nr:hypothetical protein [Pseudomonadota bacterium]
MRYIKDKTTLIPKCYQFGIVKTFFWVALPSLLMASNSHEPVEMNPSSSLQVDAQRNIQDSDSHRSVFDSQNRSEEHSPRLNHTAITIQRENTDEEVGYSSDQRPQLRYHEDDHSLNPPHSNLMAGTRRVSVNPVTAPTPLNSRKLSESVNQNPLTSNIIRSFFIQKDKEASDIREMARCIPSPCVRIFKQKFVDIADILGLSSKIMSGLCGLLVGFGGCNYITDLDLLSQETQIQIIFIASVGYLVFDKIPKLLKNVEKRDKLRLISYIKTEEFQHQKEQELGEGIYYTNDEIIEYLKNSKCKFTTLPSTSTVLVRRFLFNAMCIFESIFAFLSSFSAGFTAVSGLSGITDQNLLALKSQDLYKKITIVMMISTGILFLLNKKKSELKEHCETWLQYYSIMCYYFLHVQKIPKKELYLKTRYLGDDLISLDAQETTESAHS